MTSHDDKWLSENESALIAAIKVLCHLLTEKGIATSVEIDSALLAERDRWAARDMQKGAAILGIIVALRQRDGQSEPELPRIVRDLPQGTA